MSVSMSDSALSGFIPVRPLASKKRARSRHRPASQSKVRNLVQRKTHFYADLFGTAYGFASKEDRDAFLSRVPFATAMPGRRVSKHNCLPRYRYVVVCRSLDDARRLMRQWLFGPCDGALPSNMIW